MGKISLLGIKWDKRLNMKHFHAMFSSGLCWRHQGGEPARVRRAGNAAVFHARNGASNSEVTLWVSINEYAASRARKTGGFTPSADSAGIVTYKGSGAEFADSPASRRPDCAKGRWPVLTPVGRVVLNAQSPSRRRSFAPPFR